MTHPNAGPERPRLHRQRRAHADRQVRRRAGDGPGHRARRRRDPRRASSAPACPTARPDRRGPHGPGPPGGRRPGAGAPGGRSRAGLPDTTSATTINRVCGSGLKAIMLAAAEIRAGDAERRRRRRHGDHEPGAVPAARRRFGYRLGNGTLGRRDRPRRPVVRDRGLPHGHPRRAGRDQRRRVSREDQDAFALASHQKAVAAHRRRPLRRRDGAGHGPRREGPRDRRRPSTRARGATRRSRRWPG